MCVCLLTTTCSEHRRRAVVRYRASKQNNFRTPKRLGLVCPRVFPILCLSFYGSSSNKCVISTLWNKKYASLFIVTSQSQSNKPISLGSISHSNKTYTHYHDDPLPQSHHGMEQPILLRLQLLLLKKTASIAEVGW